MYFISILVYLSAIIYSTSSGFHLNKGSHRVRRVSSYASYDKTLAKEGEFPYMVLVFSNKIWKCGGTLISSQWVLTAAHCIQPSPNIISIRYGSNNFFNGMNVQGNAVVHPKFIRSKIESSNDIALVRLKRKLSYITPIELPQRKSETLTENDVVVSPGWGYYRYLDKTDNQEKTEDFPSVLRKVKLAVRSEKICKTIYKSLICAGNQTENLCGGDSGAPAIKDNIQFGIHTTGMIQTIKGNVTEEVCRGPVGFVAVNDYIDWINCVIQLDEKLKYLKFSRIGVICAILARNKFETQVNVN